MNFQTKTLRLSRGSQLILDVLQKTKELYSARQIYDVLRVELNASAAGIGQGEKVFEAVHPGEQIQIQHGFEVRMQILELFGVCANCRGSGLK
jgi:Fe2+ or Zn2+ uptake regulation protein